MSMSASDSQTQQARIVELETRLAFQEHAMLELSDALAELRAEAARSADLLRRVLEELKLNRGDLMADPADEPPPPHY
jgi:SlyX protein